MLSLLKPSKSNILISGSIATTAASFYGSLPYFQQELGNTPMAITAVGVMSMGIYFGWDSFLNHKKWSVKMISAGIALSCTLLSSYSIYQNTMQPVQQAQEAKQAEQSAKHQRAVLLQQKITSSEITRLKKLNAEDREQKRAFERKLTNHPKFQTTRKTLKESIASLSKSINKRETSIENKTRRLDEIVASKKFTPRVNNQSQTSWKENPATLARSAIYDSMTFLLLLMSGFYKEEKARKVGGWVIEAEKAKKELKTAITIAEKQAKKTHNSNCEVTKDLTIEDFYNLLKKEQIKTSARSLLTPINVSEATGKGLPTAKKWLNQAAIDGLIKSWSNRRGTNYCYLNKQEKLAKRFKEAQINNDHHAKLTVVGA